MRESCKSTSSAVLQRSALALGRRIPTPSGMGSWGWRKKKTQASAQPGGSGGGYQSRVFVSSCFPHPFLRSSGCCSSSSEGAVLYVSAAMPGAGCPVEPVLRAWVMHWALGWLGSANNC